MPTEPRMPIQRGTEAFLKTEEEVNQLLEELKGLRQQANAYASAKEAVGQAAAGVSSLSGELVNVAGRMREIVDTLRSIATPQILDELDAVKLNVSEARSQLEAQVGETRLAFAELTNVFQTILGRFDGQAAERHNAFVLKFDAAESDYKRRMDAMQGAQERQAAHSLEISAKRWRKQMALIAGIGSAELLLLGLIAFRIFGT